MKRKLEITIIVLCMAIISGSFMFAIWQIAQSQGSAPETLLLRSQSADGVYALEAYRTEPGATVDFSVKVYLVEGETRKEIYNAYHEREADIVWDGPDMVTINGKTLDLAAGETYDWRRK